MEDNKRRNTDLSAMRQLWEWMTPWGQILGFMILGAFIIGGKSQQFDAQAAILADHDKRLAALEVNSSATKQMVQDMAQFLGVYKHHE